MRLIHTPAVVPGGNSQGPQANDELFVGAREQKSSQAGVARAEVPIKEPFEQLTPSVPLQAGHRLSPNAAVRRFIRRDLESAARVRLQALHDPRVLVDRREELIIFGQEPKR